ncbi:hypothetical protein DFJ43DRAFT_988159 [Lentinula guzmanii]|uniref:TMEM205-like domain-containing protein n=2 Tax=Lentinula TaxID=5352 RepID=A0AA38N4L1_9AGAR|nr:hypothetical protein DFJ43DRAFT_988159 [Lentinula guzmanii]KAJ3785286.1 hypothetical protein GGU10DRAFT_269558 [Lentinula aff. detonsa]KAJ3798113.1 hypothetical protein GGU11DRAFT_682251 [Lentinula aff. detonsa]
MSKVEDITISSLLNLFSFNGLYMILYSWLFGMSLWITFFGGIIAFKALPRQQFGNLQHKTFPVYFVISLGLVSGLLLLWTNAHPDAMTYWDRPLVADVLQVYILISVLIAQGTNYFVIGPMTSRTMFERHRLEKEEGKAYNEPGVSDGMKALNRRFGSLHGISSLLNLSAVLAIGFHGLWIGNAGVKGY